MRKRQTNRDFLLDVVEYSKFYTSKLFTGTTELFTLKRKTKSTCAYYRYRRYNDMSTLLPKERICTCCHTIDDGKNRSRQLVPKPVDFQWSVSQENQNDASSLEYTISTAVNHTNTDVVTSPTKTLLMQNFETYGWSSIRIRWNVDDDQESSRPAKSKIHSMSSAAFDLLQQYRHWEQIHSELFHGHDLSKVIREKEGSCSAGSLRYVPSESGASGTTIAETKVSWEFQRGTSSKIDDESSNIPTTSSSANNDEKINTVKCRLHAWTEILHNVIWHVMEELQLPKEKLIVQYNDTDDTITSPNKDFSKSEQNLCQQPLDLLRAFRYDPVSSVIDSIGTVPHGDDDDHHEKTTASQPLGSSPHTDWGSWTVVWQDDTCPPCLQTYCYHCRKWNAVASVPLPTSNSKRDNDVQNSNMANFIVHVGDITSLCIRHTIQSGLVMKQSISSTLSPSNDTVRPDIRNIWPSPRHRVISPLQQHRHSLVYFVYPPPDSTPALITDSLLDWCQAHYGNSPVVDSNIRIPYEDYSLLCDQSAHAILDTVRSRDEVKLNYSSDTNHFSMRWRDIQSIPMRNILQEKWQQVQR